MSQHSLLLSADERHLLQEALIAYWTTTHHDEAFRLLQVLTEAAPLSTLALSRVAEDR